MPNRVFLNKVGIIEQIYEGNQTAETIREMVENTEKISAPIRERKGRVLFLTDMTKVGSATYGSRKTSLEALVKGTYDWIALFGAPPFTRHLADAVIRVAGAEKKCRNFNTRKEARAWLEEKDKR